MYHIALQAQTVPARSQAHIPSPRRPGVESRTEAVWASWEWLAVLVAKTDPKTTQAALHRGRHSRPPKRSAAAMALQRAQQRCNGISPTLPKRVPNIKNYAWELFYISTRFDS